MSNTTFINANKIINFANGKVSFSIEIEDDYNSGSVSLDIEEMPKTDLDALQYLIDFGTDLSKDVSDLVDAILEYEYGVYINNTPYDWVDIKHLFNKK